MGQANTLVNAAVEDGSIDGLGLVVVDELHMVADASRGFVLEILAAKLLSLGTRVQLVGMSATISACPPPPPLMPDHWLTGPRRTWRCWASGCAPPCTSATSGRSR